MRTAWIFLVMALILLAWEVPARAVEDSGNLPEPIVRARWLEDWSTVDVAPIDGSDSTAADYFWAPIKHIPLGDSGTSYLALGGEFRLHFEEYDEADMGITDIGLQNATQLRLAAHADWHINPRWRIFGQLGYADVSDREGGEKAADKGDLNIWQLFIDHRMPLENDERIVFRIGRQMIETANLFINAGEGNSVRQYYDGLRVVRTSDDFTPIDTFVAEYVDFADGRFDMSGTGEYFWGGRAGVHLPAQSLDLHFLYTGWSLKDRQFEQGGGESHDEFRHTFLLWLNRALTFTRQWGLDYYLAYQSGEYDDRPGGSDISAYAAFGEMRYALNSEPRTPMLSLKTSYFSGDHDPEDDELNTFYDPVFATPYFGYARDIQPFNLVQVQPAIGYRFANRGRITLSYGFFWRAEANDAYYGKPNAVITAPADASDSRQLGQQIELSIRFMPVPNWIVSSYLARFYAGDTIVGAGGDDRDYIHAGIHYLF